MKVRTAGYGGHALRKTVRVHSNDPDRPVVTLGIQGQVTTVVRVSPDRVNFRGKLGDLLAVNVRLTASPGVSMTVTAIHAMGGKDIRLELAPPPGTPSKEYLLTVTSTRNTPGEIHDTVAVFTSIAGKPKIIIPVTGVVLAK